MRIQVEQTSEVTVSKETMRKICLTYLEELLGYDPEVTFIEGKALVQEFEVSAGCHSYFEKTVIKRKASKADITLLEAIKLVQRG